MMVTAFDVLFRYTVNMLKLKRPRNWQTIKFSNANFKARADCMVGTRNILNLMGYTKPVFGEDADLQSGLAYPDPAVVDVDKIKVIGTELLTAKIEVKTVQEGRGNFNNPLPLANIPLQNPQPPKHPQLDDMYSSNLPQPPPSHQFNSSVSGGPMGSGSFDGRGSQDSHHGGFQPPSGNYNLSQHSSYQSSSGNSNLSQHSSFQPPSTSGSYQYRNQSSPVGSFGQGSAQPDFNEQPSSSYGQGNSQPHHNQQFDYQSINQYSNNSGYGPGNMQSQGNQQQMDYQRSSESGYQSRHQLSGRSSDTMFASSTEFSQPSSTEQQPRTTFSRLAELRKKKEGILQNIKQSTQGDSSAYPPSTGSQVEPAVTMATSQPSSVPLPSSNAAAQPKPPPIKPRTKIHALASDVKHSRETDLPPLDEDTSQAQKPPAQKAPVQKRGPRIMMECNVCGFYNHEKSQECMECENSKNEHWREVKMPGRDDGSTHKQQQNVAPTKTPSTLHSQPLLPEREAQQFHSVEATPPSAQYNDQPSSVGSAQSNTSGDAAGASGTSSTPQRDWKDFVPAVKYTPEEKERIKKEYQEKERLIAQQQQQGMDGGGAAEATPLTSFMPKNNQYSMDSGERPTGNALFNVSNVGEPENAELYKNLANQGRDLIQDIKVTIVVYNGKVCQYTIMNKNVP